MALPNLETVELPQLSLELTLLTGMQAPGYRSLWLQVVDGKLPAVKQGNRWHVRRADLPDVARSLGMVRRPARQSDIRDLAQA